MGVMHEEARKRKLTPVFRYGSGKVWKRMGDEGYGSCVLFASRSVSAYSLSAVYRGKHVKSRTFVRSAWPEAGELDGIDPIQFLAQCRDRSILPHIPLHYT